MGLVLRMGSRAGDQGTVVAATPASKEANYKP